MDYDLVIVGSGGAAFAAAIRGASLGGRVAVIERGEVGGTCVNVGCVPSKTLLAGAEVFHRAAGHRFAGLSTQAGDTDLAALVAQKDELVGRLQRAKYLDLAEAYGFEIVPAEARFVSPDALSVDGREVRVGVYLIATGAEPTVPDLPGLREAGFLTSTTAMQQREVPERLVAIGGGFVGMEQSQLWSRLGSQVTIVGCLAPWAEPEMAAWMRRAFADEGIRNVESRAVAVERSSDGVIVVTGDGTRLSGDKILVAVGRSPRSAAVDVDAAGIKTDSRGAIVVDAEQRTSNPRVFAAGDVVGGPEFVYVAAGQGQVAADNALTDAHATLDYTGLPSVIFTSPALASAGLTEREALAAGYRCDCRVLELENVPRALVNHDTRGAIKLVAEAGTGKVLGVHAVADHAGELMLAATYAIKFGLAVDDLAGTWAPYLTMNEGLKLVAQSFRGDVKRLSCCAA